MQIKSLSSLKDSKSLKRFARKIQSGRYFHGISLFLLEEMLSKGELVSLNEDEFLTRQDNNHPPELIILLEGSLVVSSDKHSLMRLDQPGDIFGEMSITCYNQEPFPKVISEKSSQAVILPYHIFEVEENETKVSIAYFILSHILSEKLRHSTAHSLLKKNIRSHEKEIPVVAIIDPDDQYRKKIKSLIKYSWEKTRLIEINSFSKNTENSFKEKIDFFIIDPEKLNYGISKKDSIRKFIQKFSIKKTPILVISKFCKKEENKKFLLNLGVTDFLKKPFSDFDLKHKLIRFRTDHFRQKELEQVEIEADTDRLTGLANRRKLDEFLDALVTVFSEDKQPFSIIIADIDNFKHYNDTNGHQLGDVVLSSVATILKNNIRRGDLAARYGGEEFVIILPNCSKKNAIKIGNKLRLAIAEENLPGQEKQPLGNLTCTFGLASFPKDAKTKELLLKNADKCLYRGKASGRNKLVAYYEKNFVK